MRWHPDKWWGKFGSRVKESEKELVLKKVQHASQVLTHLSSQLAAAWAMESGIYPFWCTFIPNFVNPAASKAKDRTLQSLREPESKVGEESSPEQQSSIPLWVWVDLWLDGICKLLGVCRLGAWMFVEFPVWAWMHDKNEQMNEVWFWSGFLSFLRLILAVSCFSCVCESVFLKGPDSTFLPQSSYCSWLHWGKQLKFGVFTLLASLTEGDLAAAQNSEVIYLSSI